jgi:hypothetical protein
VNGRGRARFRLNEWDGDLAQRRTLALEEARALDESLLISTDLDVLSTAIIDEVGPQPLTLLTGEMWNERRESYQRTEGSLPTDLPPLELIFHAPVTGAASLLSRAGLYQSAGTYQRTPGQQGWRLSLSVSVDDSVLDEVTLAAEIEKGIATWRDALREAIDKANIGVAEHREAVRGEVRELLDRRRRRIRAVHAGVLAADIALQPSDAPALIPLQPKTLTLETVERLADSGGSEHRLAVEIADSLVGTIAAFGKALERLHQTANRLLREDEEGLRDVLLFLLNANWAGLATGETFIGAGKSDILLRWRDKDAFIAECKIWRGSKALSDGVEQLLTRYTVWRDTRVALILFIRDRHDVSSAIKAAYDGLAVHDRTLRALPPPETFGDQRSFVMSSAVDHRRAVTLTLVPVVVPGDSQH